MEPVKIVIVDDHPTFRKGLIVQLSEIPGVKVIGEASTGKEFIDNYLQLSPDIVFMDINMPEMDGIVATRKAIFANPSVKIIAISTYGEIDLLQGMMDSGAKGFLLKNVDFEDIASAIKSIMAGKIYYSSEMLSVLSSKFVERPSENNCNIPIRFSSREVQVLQLICEGITNAEIGEKLFLSPRTVDGHRANLISKVGAKNTVGLVTYAIKNKLVKL